MTDSPAGGDAATDESIARARSGADPYRGARSDADTSGAVTSGADTSGAAGSGVETSGGADRRLGLSVTHRRYVGYHQAHYAGHLVDGAFTLGLFGDVATEISIRTDGDEGLFVGYGSVEFLAPVRAGDVVETEGTVTRVGKTSREITFVSRVTCRATAAVDEGNAATASASQVLAEPIETVRAVGTVVVPKPVLPEAGDPAK